MKWLWLGAILVAAAGSNLLAAEPAPFRVGEKLHYRMLWGPLVIGDASLEVRNIEPVDGHNCYHIVAEARTVGLGRLLVKLESSTESWFDVEGHFSRRFREDRQEGRHSKRQVTEFDYNLNEAVTRNLVNGRERRSAIASHVQDIISSVYYLRMQPLALNRQAQFTVNASAKNWPVAVRPDKRQQLEVRPVGEVSALRIEPTPTLNFVAANKGRMWFWVSDDARKLPLVVNSTMVIGTAKLVLYKIEEAPATKVAQTPTAAVIAAIR